MKIGRTASVTDKGRRRLRNEDAYVCQPPLFAVADGMGGAQAGELASRLAAASLKEFSRDRGEQSAADLVQEANARIYRRSREDPAAAGMGSTITLALVDGAAGTVALAHVGDSRAYLLRGGSLKQLTHDHSLVAELVRNGRLTEEEAENHPQRSVITRVLGTDPDVDVDTPTVAAEPGDLYVLCSDGLTAMLRDDEILAVLEEADGEPERAARMLVAAANQAGGDDNITVVAFEVREGDELEPSAPPDELDLTAEDAVTVAAEAADSSSAEGEPEVPVRRHGAGKGGRLLAIAFVLLALAAALFLLWWGISG